MQNRRTGNLPNGRRESFLESPQALQSSCHLSALLRPWKVKSYPRGAQLFMQNCVPSVVIWVERGLVKLTRVGLTGSETILALRGSGSILGSEEAMCKERYVASAVTATEARICGIPSDEYVNALQSNLALLIEIHRVLNNQNLDALRQAGKLGGDSAKCRLLSFLAGLIPTKSGDALRRRIQLPIREWELAQLLAITPWHLSRLLRECVAGGLLEKEKGWLVVRNASFLASAADL